MIEGAVKWVRRDQNCPYKFYTKSMFSYLFQMVQTSSYVLTLGFDSIIAFLIVGIVAMSGLQFTA